MELSPFAKDHRSEPGLVERFECFAGGMEFANAFTELNDPDEQRARFEEQRADEAAGDEETQPYDEDYVARAGARHAARPAASAIGIDRLVMMLIAGGSIREVVLFPAMQLSAQLGRTSGPLRHLTGPGTSSHRSSRPLIGR